MVFGAMDAYNLKDLTVVPVGVNYSNPSQFRGNLFFNVGEPIHISEYMATYNEAPAKTMNQFLADLTPKMKELIVHINHPYNETLIAHLEEIYKSDYFAQHQLNTTNLEDDFKFSTHIVTWVNKLEEEAPERLKLLSAKTENYFNQLKQYQLKDWLIDPLNQSKITFLNVLLRFLVIVLSFPIYVRGLLGSYIPYFLTAYITNKKVKIIEFKASFLIGIGAVMFLLFGLIQFFIAKALAPNAWWALLVLVITVLTGMYCLWLSPFRKKTFGILKALQLKSKQPQVFRNLQDLREDIINDFKNLTL